MDEKARDYKPKWRKFWRHAIKAILSSTMLVLQQWDFDVASNEQSHQPCLSWEALIFDNARSLSNSSHLVTQSLLQWPNSMFSYSLHRVSTWSCLHSTNCRLWLLRQGEARHSFSDLKVHSRAHPTTYSQWIILMFISQVNITLPKIWILTG